MNTKTLFGRAIVAAAVCASASAAIAAEGEVATLARITGDAVVSKGAQYVSAAEGMALKVGERVMSLATSTTTIQFNDGCRYVLEANQLLTIEGKSPCALGLAGQPGGGAVAAAGANLGWLPAAGALGIFPLSLIDTGSDSRPNPPAISP